MGRSLRTGCMQVQPCPTSMDNAILQNPKGTRRITAFYIFLPIQSSSEYGQRDGQFKWQSTIWYNMYSATTYYKYQMSGRQYHKAAKLKGNKYQLSNPELDNGTWCQAGGEIYIYYITIIHWSHQDVALAGWNIPAWRDAQGFWSMILHANKYRLDPIVNMFSGPSHVLLPCVAE